MPEVRSNEREFQGEVVGWLNEMINAGGFPFDCATIETSLKLATGESRFPDIVVWFDRKTGAAHSLWELKPAKVPVNDPDLLSAGVEKARAVDAHYVVTFNTASAVLWKMPSPGERPNIQHEVKAYQSGASIHVMDDLLSETTKISVRDLVKDVLSDLAFLEKKGHLPSWQPDATWFVRVLVNRAQALADPATEALLSKLSSRAYRAEYVAWLRRQGFSDSTQRDDVKRMARQAVYRLIGKAIFYLTLRRERADLPPLTPFPLSAPARQEHLRKVFLEARRVDYQAVFEEELSDAAILTEPILDELAALCGYLERHDFAHLPHDVVGHVFEDIIPPEERHDLGQYFTPENLVDFMTAFAIRGANDKVIDPTCGSGTFLLRAYHRLRWQFAVSHQALLRNIWGFDIAKFPAQLATMNLYRQDLSRYDNFPRIQALDFFDVSPGQEFEFPPPKYEPSEFKIKDTLPPFDAAIGNFPFIRQGLIEKAQRGYKRKVEQVLHEEWLGDVAGDKWEYYPEMFDANNIRLSGQADIYGYLFMHTARFLAAEGRMAFITSNSWLDAGFGHELQKFFCDRFKIVAIVESRCEPWFSEAAINTVFTVVERCDDAKERSGHRVKFVKVKRKLDSLIRESMSLEPIERFRRTTSLTDEIEHCHTKKLSRLDEDTACYESDNFRVRVVEQSKVAAAVHKSERTVKWGRFLRAPDVYFRLREALGDRAVPLGELAEIRRGFTTGINPFFYLTKETAGQFDIEAEFLFKVMKSPKDTKSILVDPAKLKTLAFVCRMSKNELRERKRSGALRYIEWGESQVTSAGKNSAANVRFPEVPTVRNRKFWYALPPQRATRLVWVKTYNDRFMTPLLARNTLCDQRVYTVSEKSGIGVEVLAAVLNSTVFGLSIEVSGRLPLGEGALDIAKYEAEKETLLPDIRHLSKVGAKRLTRCLAKVAKRPVKSIFGEVKESDRRALDATLLREFGLDPKEYLDDIYDGLCSLVEERLSLAKAREVRKKTKTTKDTRALVEAVEKELLPAGAAHFPEAFLSETRFQGTEINLPQDPIRVLGEYFGKVHLASASGWAYDANGNQEARYIIYAAAEKKAIVKLPKDLHTTAGAVRAYDAYVRRLWQEACEVFSGRTGDVGLAEILARDLLVRNGLSVPRDKI